MPTKVHLEGSGREQVLRSTRLRHERRKGKFKCSLLNYSRLVTARQGGDQKEKYTVYGEQIVVARRPDIMATVPKASLVGSETDWAETPWQD